MVYMTSRYRTVVPARIEQREAALLQLVTVRRHSKTQQEARLVDLSIYGCRLMTDATFDATFKIGERLWLRFAGSNPVRATAMWLDGERIGCRFDVALDRTLFRELISQSE